ncbi:MAG TPA: SLC13 family permease [Polyangiales bacterium]|nr:SLC13 family permease [Polyangiales bacterium]
MTADDDKSTALRWVLTLLIGGAAVTAALLGIADPVQARAAAIGASYLTFALSELVPAFVPTLFLLVAIPLALRTSLGSVLSWSADPVLALFAGGLALGVAAERHGIDRAFAALLLRLAGRSRRAQLGWVMFAGLFLSMWLSNIAAAALLLTALKPTLDRTPDLRFRRSALLALAMSTNLGGITTPIGSGPNAIAIAETRELHTISFLQWMGFGVPIAWGMAVVAYLWLVLRYGVAGEHEAHGIAAPEVSPRGRSVVFVLAAGIVAWLTEPLHGVAAPIVALALMLVLFASGLLSKADLGALDWSTLGLIAGGLTLGRMLEHAGVLTSLAGALPLADYPRWLWLGGLVFASAVLSGLMSNTATAALLIPLGLQLDGSASTAVIIAVATSFGMPFAISTPPNALVFGTGNVRTSDLLQVGLGLMLLGCVTVTYSGAWVLHLFGLD